MSVRIIVPHRGFAAAKTRLASVLDDDERESLARRLLEHVLDVVTAVAPGQGELISPDPALATVAEEKGVRLAVQRGMGLNAGLDQARAVALREGIAMLAVLHGDLPQLTAADLRALLSAVPPGGGVAIAPDAAGSGTNGLALRPADAIAFAFGPGSFEAHRQAASRAGYGAAIVDRPGLAFDLDTPQDLARWLTGSNVA